MTSKRNVKIETPGEASADSARESSEDYPAEAKAAPTAADTSQLTPTQEVTLKQDLIKTAKLVGSNDALDWSSLNNGLTPSTAKVDPEAHLPTADSVDPAKITEPVLTKGGWVLPLNDKRARIGLK